MVPPLDIHIMELHQLVHDDVRPGAPVEDIADDMEIIDGQVLDQVAQGDDELVPHLDIQDRVQDLAVIDLFIFIIIIHMEELIDRIGKFLGHLLSYLRAGIFGRYHLADAHQAIDRHLLPVLCISPSCPHLPDHPLRIIDQVRQFHLLLLRDDVSEGLLDLLPDDP